MAGHAPSGRAAYVAGQRRQITPPRHLDEDGAVGESFLGKAPGGRGEVRSSCWTIAFEIVTFPGHGDFHRRLTDGFRGGSHGSPFTGGDPVGDTHAATEAGREQRRSAERCPDREHLAHVRVGSARLLVEVIPVVPPGDQTEVLDRREGRCARADNGAHMAAEELEPGGVAGLRALIGREPDVPLGPESPRECPIDAIDVPLVWHDDEHAAAGVERHSGGIGEQSRPVTLRRLTGKRQERGSGVLSLPQTPEEGRSCGVCRPRWRGIGSGRWWQRGLQWWRHRESLLSGRMALGHRQPQDVTEHPGIPIGDSPRGLDEIGGQDRLITDHAPQGREPTRVLGLGASSDDKTVQISPGEAHLDPHAWLGRGIESGRDGILELSVQVR